MSSSGLSSPDYLLPSQQYTYDALAPLVTHPELAGSSVRDHEIEWILPSLVTLGRVALHYDDIANYRAWSGHTEGFVDAFQARKTFITQHHYLYLAQLRFFGAMHSDALAADKLHVMLDDDPRYRYMPAVLQLCARHNVEPNEWIERHSTGADEKARSWGVYVYERLRLADERGETASPAELLPPGGEEHIQDFLDGNLDTSSKYTIFLPLMVMPKLRKRIGTLCNLYNMAAAYIFGATRELFWLQQA